MSRSARDLDSAHSLARILTFALDRALDRNLDRSLSLDLAHARHIGLDLARHLAQAQAQALARDLSRDLHVDVDFEHRWGSYEELLDQIRHASRSANQIVRLLRATAPGAHASSEPASPAEPARLAVQLAQFAARVLPVADQARYSDEYRSELYELAAARVSRLRQMLHAVRLIDRAWVLRAELRAPASRRERT
jgi:hypothetical protein